MKDKRRKKVYPKTVAKIENEEENDVEKKEKEPIPLSMLFSGIICIPTIIILFIAVILRLMNII